MEEILYRLVSVIFKAYKEGIFNKKETKDLVNSEIAYYWGGEGWDFRKLISTSINKLNDGEYNVFEATKSIHDEIKRFDEEACRNEIEQIQESNRWRKKEEDK